MDFKTIFSYQSLKMRGFLLTTFLLLLITNGSGIKSSIKKDSRGIPELIRLSSSQIKVLFGGNDILSNVEASLKSKSTAVRKRYKQLIEGDDDHTPYIKKLQYASNLDSFVKINYESPYFVSQQQLFLFRLSVF